MLLCLKPCSADPIYSCVNPTSIHAASWWGLSPCIALSGIHEKPKCFLGSQDQNLDTISEGLTTLKNMAEDIGEVCPWCQWLVGKWKTCWKKKVKFQIWYQTPLMIITRLWWCCSLTNSWSRIGKCLLKAINLMVFYGVANVRQIDGSVAEMVQELNKQDPLIEDLDSKVDLFQA